MVVIFYFKFIIVIKLEYAIAVHVHYCTQLHDNDTWGHAFHELNPRKVI